MTIKDDIELLFREHYAAMWRLAMLILREDDVARDIVQMSLKRCSYPVGQMFQMRTSILSVLERK